MSDPISNPTSEPVAANSVPMSRFADPVPLLKAVADPVRYRVLKEMAGGDYPSVLALAKKLGVHPDMMGKHIKVLRDAGAVMRVRPADSDGRQQFHQIPKEFRQKSESGQLVVDYGACVLRF